MIKITKIALLSIIIISLISCSNDIEENYNFEKPILVQNLNNTSNVLYIDGFVDDYNSVDSVFINGIKMSFYQSKKMIAFQAEDFEGAYLIMNIWQKGVSTDIVLKRSQKQKVMLNYSGEFSENKEISMAGDFNGWTPSKTILEWHDTAYQQVVFLAPGKYPYQIVENGEWKVDEFNENTAPNGQGGTNSILIVGESNIEPIKLISESYSENVFSFYSNNDDIKIVALFNNEDISTSIVRVDGNFLITIPAKAKQYDLSYIRIFAYDKNMVSNDLLIPLANGLVANSIEQLPRTAWQTNILYNVFVDRFFDGNTENNNPLSDSIVLHAANYNGGDMEGLMNIIDSGYFADLGVNALWLSPLVKNVEGAYGYWPDPKTKFSAYHGYWPTSFTQINPHFGNSDDLHSLVAKVHGADMNILLDFVANHVHQDHPFIKENPEYATELYLPDGSLNLERWDEYRLTTWFDKFLPSLNLENEVVAKTVADSATWWITEYDVDGFRHDAAKHVPLSFWRTLTREIKDSTTMVNNKQVYQLGETYGSSELIGSYVNNAMLDAQFDFNVYDAAVGVFAAGNSMQSLAEKLNESMHVYGSHNIMAYITGNQDRARFISYAGGQVSFDEDAKKAGWTRKIGVGKVNAYKKLQQLMAFNMTIPGIPVIYYGDEFGMPGGNDPDSRRMMRFDGQLSDIEANQYSITKKLISIRKNNMALLYGDFIYIQADDSSMVYARKYFDNIVYVVFNNSETELKIELITYDDTNLELLKANFNGKLIIEDDKIFIFVAANSFEIIN